MTLAVNLANLANNANAAGQISLATGVTNILPVANGGTGNSTGTVATATNATNAVNLTGTIASLVTAVTQASTDNSTKVATTAYARSLITGSNASNGYVKLPNGLIIQWGLGADTGTGSTANWQGVFPITFPNALLQYSVQCTGGTLTSTIAVINVINGQSTTSLLKGTMYITGNGQNWTAQAGQGGRYIVVGY